MCRRWASRSGCGFPRARRPGGSCGFAGQGVPAAAGAPPGSAGDLIVTVQIVLPPVRDERSKDLLREFGQLNGQHVRDFLFEGE